MKLTAREIAKQVGVSNATVSRVLHKSPNVSAAAREAVMSVVRENGQMPHLLAPRVNPRRRKDGQLPGLVRILQVSRFPIPRLAEPAEASSPGPHGRLPGSMFFSQSARLATSYSRHIIDGILEELRHVNLRGVVQVTERLRSSHLLREINDESNLGVVLLGVYGDDVPLFLEKCRRPVVTLMSWDHDGQPDHVGIDNLRGIRLGFDHLVALGHRRIGYVAGELPTSAVFRERLMAYRTLLLQHNFPFRPEWVLEGSCAIDQIERAAAVLLRPPERPTAMLCCFDGAALAVQRAAASLGLRVPRDLSVVGFDDEDIAQLFTPPLTTVRVPTMLMGQMAVQLMMMRMNRPSRMSEGCSVRVTPTLVVRQSTAAPLV